MFCGFRHLNGGDFCKAKSQPQFHKERKLSLARKLRIIKMKVVLFGLNGSFSHTNLAIRRLRPALEAEGFDVKLVEAGLRDADSAILETLVDENADIYGFSAYIWNIKRLLPIAEDLSSVLPNAFIVFGGPEVTYSTERFEDAGFIDCIIKGAGESALPSVCRSLKEGKNIPRIIDGGKTPLSEGILYRMDEHIKTTLYYESAVGCPYSCAFCLSSATCGVEAKSAETTLSELLEFEKLEGDFIVKFVDRTFNFNIKRANAIWRGLLDPKYTKRYQFEICAELLNEESFEILGKFPRGRVQLEAGLQSTNEKTLAAVARHLDSKATLDACRRIKEQGNVHVHVDLIAGLPFEDYESFKKSFNDAYPCGEQLQLGFLKLLHGTALRNKADEYGYRFTADPPYTVLSNNWMSYKEIRRLDAIADLVERYGNSGHFSRCLEYAMPYAASPFDFYEGLLDFINVRDGRNIRRIGQNDAYELLYSYAEGLPSIDAEILSRELHGDYTASEVRRPPRIIR